MAYFHSNAVIPIYITPFFTTKVVVQEYAVNFLGERKRLKWAIVGPHSEKDTLQNLMKFFANHEKFRAWELVMNEFSWHCYTWAIRWGCGWPNLDTTQLSSFKVQLPQQRGLWLTEMARASLNPVKLKNGPPGIGPFFSRKLKGEIWGMIYKPPSAWIVTLR